MKIGFLFHVFVKKKNIYTHSTLMDYKCLHAHVLACRVRVHFIITLYVILNKWKNNRQCCDSNYNHNCLNRQFFDCLENVVTDERSVGCLSGV